MHRQFLKSSPTRRSPAAVQDGRADGNVDADRGFILPLALVLTIVLGSLVVAIASYTTTSLKYGRTIQERADRLAASDAGARIALEKLRSQTASCTTSSTVIYTTTVNDRSVSVSCERTVLLPNESDPFALVVTAQGVPAGTPSWISQGTNVSSQPRKIGGNVYLAVPPATLDKPVSVTDGDIWYPATSGACTDPAYDTVTFEPPAERGFNCTTSSWQDMFPVPPLPNVVAAVRPATGKTDGQGCTVFQPGLYTSPPVIGAGTQNFFQPGTYYFNFNGAIEVKNALVIGGVPGLPSTDPPYQGSSAVALTPATFTSPWCADAMASAAAATSGPNTGVTWIFGSESSLALDSNAVVELFAPPALVAGQQFVPSVVALQSNDPDGRYVRNTLGSTGEALLDMKEGSKDGLVIHGAVWAPANAVRIGNIAQDANGQFMGGLVVGLLNMQAAANVGNFNMRVLTYPAQRKILVTSTADSMTTTKVVALVRSSTGELKINSWRVE